jgi:hypothetical protein
MKIIQFRFKWFLVMATGLLLASGGMGLADAQDTFSCSPTVEMDADTKNKAKLDKFSCFFKEWEGGKTVHFEVAVKNVSASPQRYRVNIFLNNGKAVGGLIPRKTSKGLVPPGQTASFVYPVKNMPQKPEDILVKLSTTAP